MMTLSYMTGLTAGSLVGYVFDGMLGPQIPYPCLQYPYIPIKPVINITTQTTTQATTTALSTILPSSTEQITQLILTTIFTTLTTTAIPIPSTVSSFNSSLPFISSDNTSFIASTTYMEQSSTQIMNSTLFDD